MMEEGMDVACFGIYVHEEKRITELQVKKNCNFSIICGTALCNKIYRVNFLKEHKIKFPDNRLPYEDDFFLLSVFVNNPTYQCTIKPIYNYDKSNSNSVSSTAPIQKFKTRNIHLERIFYLYNQKINNLSDIFNVCDYFYKNYIQSLTYISRKEASQYFSLYRKIYNISKSND